MVDQILLCGKVRFIPCLHKSETAVQYEVHTLSQFTSARHDQEKIEKRSDVDMEKNQVRSASPPKFNKSSNMKCMSPSRSDTEVHAPLTRSMPASYDKSNIENRSEFATRKSHVPHASPPNVKQLSNSNCISPRSDTQVHVLKRCVAASHEARISTNREAQHGSSMPMANKCRTQVAVKRKLDSQVDEKTKERKIAMEIKEKTFPRFNTSLWRRHYLFQVCVSAERHFFSTELLKMLKRNPFE
jgi:hypothetical protein